MSRTAQIRFAWPTAALLCVIAITLTACSKKSEPTAANEVAAVATPEGPRDPAHIYVEQCATCHEGNVPKAPHSITFQMIGPRGILAALTNGVMKQQGANLTPKQRVQLAEFLGGGSLSSADTLMPESCAADVGDFDVERPPPLEGWGFTLTNSRFVPAGVAQLVAADVPKLELEWAFAYPGATRVRSQPTVGGGLIFVGSQDSTVYALDFESGCVRWSFKSDAEVRSSPTVEPWVAGDHDARPKLFFGDLIGQAYALDARSGELIWKRRVDPHPKLTITGSPRYYDGRLYVPMSSSEWAAAPDPSYECCTFRGGVAALDAATGEPIWKTYSIPEAPAPAGLNSAGAKRWHPAGVPVWNSPTIDVKRKRLYVGTGESYTSPAVETSDAVLALALEDGELLWHYQSVAGDAWNMACFIGGGANCPEENGPDFDIGAPPVLVTLPDGRDMLVVGHKSADVFALDPDDGKVLWKIRIGRGGFAGGVHWGMAVEGTRVYAPNADTLFLPSDVERGEARPGMFALDATTGETLWFTPVPDLCSDNLKPACDPGLSAAVTAIPGVLFAGGFDGWLRAFDGSNGRILWEYDTNREFDGLFGIRGHGGSIESDGPVIVDGAVFVTSGYLYGGRMPGNVLLKFRVPGAGRQT